MSIGDVAAEIASAANDMENVARQAGLVSHDLEEASADVARVTIGTSASEPEATMRSWEKAADHAQHAASLLRAGNSALAQYLKAIGSGAGSPLIEPMKSRQDLVDESREGGRGFGALQREMVKGVGDAQKSVKAVTKTLEMMMKRPTGTLTERPAGPTATPATPAGVQVDAAGSAMLAATIATTGVAMWYRKRREKRQEQNG